MLLSLPIVASRGAAGEPGGDLLDRALILYLPSIPEQNREPESKFRSDFDLARPALLGALLSAVAGALSRLPNVELNKKPRLADFAV